jgi:hypothetical protein
MTKRVMTQLGRVVVVGRGRGRGDLCEEECLSSLHVADEGLPECLSSLHVPDEGLLGGCFDAGWCEGGWYEGAALNWPGLTGGGVTAGSCPASGTALPTEKTIARRTQLTRQPRLVSQGSLRPIDAFTLNQECYSSGEFSGKNILDRSGGVQSSLLDSPTCVRRSHRRILHALRPALLLLKQVRCAT